MREREQALQPLVKTEKLPKMALSRTLDGATSRSFLYVDRHGRVRSPTRYRALEVFGYVGLAGLAAVPVLYGAMFGVWGAAVGAGLAAFAGIRTRQAHRVQQAVRLIAYSRVEEASTILEDVLSSRILMRRVRATACHNLAICWAMRGEYERALVWVRRALDIRDSGWQRSLHARLAGYLQVTLLVDLDRVSSARLALDHLGPAPSGEYTQVSQWVSELYVAMGEGGCTLSEDEIYERARKGLAMTTGAPLLGLAAWALHNRGDDDLAAHLLSEAFDRLDTDRLEFMMPRLYEWMCAQRGRLQTTMAELVSGDESAE